MSIIAELKTTISFILFLFSKQVDSRPFSFSPLGPHHPSPSHSPHGAHNLSPSFASPSLLSALPLGSRSPGSSSLSDQPEPRRRAPRALTGRHVRSGTGASPEVLAKLREKILQRKKLKEILGESSELYFGALNKQKKNKANLPRPNFASLLSSYGLTV